MRSDQQLFSSPAYKRSRAAYNAQCAIDHFASLLVADAYLAKLLTSLGISDSVIGIISSLISLSFMFQIIPIFLMGRLRTVKKPVTACYVIGQFFFLMLYLVPPIAGRAPHGVKTALVFTCVMGGYLCKNMVCGLYSKWANSYVMPENRGVFSATKEMTSLMGGIIFTLIIGFAVDKFEAAGNLEGSFIFIAAVMLVLNILEFVVFYNIKKDEPNDDEKLPLISVIKKLVRNKGYMGIVAASSIWYASVYLTTGFLGTYKTTELMFTVGIVQVINMFGNLSRFAVSRPFGRYSDKTSFANGYFMSLVILAAAFLVNIFTTPSTKWLIVVFGIVYDVSLAGSYQNNTNMVYSYVPVDYFVQALSLKNCLSGLIGFLASIAGGRILALVQANGNTVFGIHMYGQQLLSAISFVLMLVCMLVIKSVVSKQKVMKQ